MTKSIESRSDHLVSDNEIGIESGKKRTRYSIAKEIVGITQKIEFSDSEEEKKELFGEFFNLCGPPIRKQLKSLCLKIRKNAFSKIKNEEKIDYSYFIDDVLQKTFISISKHFDSFLSNYRRSFEKVYEKHGVKNFGLILNNVWQIAYRNLVRFIETEQRKNRGKSISEKEIYKKVSGLADKKEVDPADSVVFEEFLPFFEKILKRLSERNQKIAKERYIKGKTLEEIAELFKVTKQRVKQIIVNQIEPILRKGLIDGGFQEFLFFIEGVDKRKK